MPSTQEFNSRGTTDTETILRDPSLVNPQGNLLIVGPSYSVWRDALLFRQAALHQATILVCDPDIPSEGVAGDWKRYLRELHMLQQQGRVALALDDVHHLGNNVGVEQLKDQLPAGSVATIIDHMTTSCIADQPTSLIERRTSPAKANTVRNQLYQQVAKGYFHGLMPGGNALIFVRKQEISDFRKYLLDQGFEVSTTEVYDVAEVPLSAESAKIIKERGLTSEKDDFARLCRRISPYVVRRNDGIAFRFMDPDFRADVLMLAHKPEI